MPFRLKISNEEVKSELVKMGYSNLSEDTVNEFRKDLLKLIKEDLKNIKKLKKSQEQVPDEFKVNGSLSTSATNSEILKEKMIRSPTLSGYSETFHDSSESQNFLPFKNAQLRGKRVETASASSSSSSLSEESAKSIVSSKLPITKDLRITTDTQKTEKTIPLTKMKDSKDKGLPSYPDKPDAVNLYHFYKAHWDKYKVPGEDPRSALRWEIRSQLFYSS